MIVDFEDACWTTGSAEWDRSLVELLVLLVKNEQHAILADSNALLLWCARCLPTHVEYFKIRLAAAQCRANSLTVYVSVGGAAAAVGAPPWILTANAAQDIVSAPLRLFLENNKSDQMFVEATIPAFAKWRDSSWVTAVMGGGTAMQGDMKLAANDDVARWRTFFLFDSDRLHPDELNPGWAPPGGDRCQGHQFESLCAGLPANRWHRLSRRSIENYLPQAVLVPLNQQLAITLSSPSVGNMVKHFNFKEGLAGDGVSPPRATHAVRASRSKGFWLALTAAEVATLQNGFGSNVSNEFSNIPANYSWSHDVVSEAASLSDALQDAL
ncbi:hypothetical protein [Roseateles sp. BYS96W]|uniref:Uncharacterized protein n=1 Tax=Pelomonas nitida TaxID=3299027 RepID=A0ABW7GDF9_9BURK